MFRHHIHTEIEIEAAPEEVWAVLTDLDRYDEWNPLVVSSSGTVEEGARLVNRLISPGGREMTFRPTVTEVDEARVFEWLGRLLVPGLFDGRHRFELVPTPTGTLLRHTEAFRGLMVPFLRRSLDRDSIPGFEEMNEALRTRVTAARTAP